MVSNYYPNQKHSLNLKNNILVPVIASYNCDGSCTPLYFRYTDDHQCSESIKIDKVLFTKPNSVFGTLYYCQVTIHDHMEQIILFFHTEETKWYLRTT